MTILEFLAATIESLAWPGLIGVAILSFREPLSDLLQKITSVRFGGLEADFKEQLDEIREDQDRQIQSSEGDLKTGDPSVEAPEDRILTLSDLADISPRGAVVEAWVDIERASAEYIEKKGGNPKVLMYGLHKLPNHLRGPLDHILGQYDGLRRLRNEAVHGSDFAITPKAARDYISASSYVAKAIRQEASKQD